MTIPTDRQYSAEHEWVVLDGQIATVGITQFAAEALGDVVYTELPAPNDDVTAGQVCGEIESTKSVSDLYSPVTGRVIEVNDAVADAPELVNDAPYADGWLFKVEITELGELMDADAYARHIEE